MQQWNLNRRHGQPVSCSQSRECVLQWVISVDTSTTEHSPNDPRQSCMGKYGEFVRYRSNPTTLYIHQWNEGSNLCSVQKLELRNESRIWRPSIHTKIEACNRQLPIESEDIRSSPWRKRSACHQGCRPSQNSWCSLETAPPQWWVNHTKRHQCADPCACHDFAWRYDPNLVAQRTGQLHREVSSPQWIIIFGSRILKINCLQMCKTTWKLRSSLGKAQPHRSRIE